MCEWPREFAARFVTESLHYEICNDGSVIGREPVGNAHSMSPHVESTGKYVVQAATVHRAARSHVILIGTATPVGIISIPRRGIFVRPAKSDVR